MLTVKNVTLIRALPFWKFQAINQSVTQIRTFNVAKTTGGITKSTEANSTFWTVKAKCLEMIGETGMSLVGAKNRCDNDERRRWQGRSAARASWSRYGKDRPFRARNISACVPEVRICKPHLNGQKNMRQLSEFACLMVDPAKRSAAGKAK